MPRPTTEQLAGDFAHGRLLRPEQLADLIAGLLDHLYSALPPPSAERWLAGQAYEHVEGLRLRLEKGETER